jgi:hypothetical protein
MISIKITSSNEDLYNFTIKLSSGEIKFDEIVVWIKNNSTAIQ